MGRCRSTVGETQLVRPGGRAGQGRATDPSASSLRLGRRVMTCRPIVLPLYDRTPCPGTRSATNCGAGTRRVTEKLGARPLRSSSRRSGEWCRCSFAEPGPATRSRTRCATSSSRSSKSRYPRGSTTSAAISAGPSGTTASMSTRLVADGERRRWTTARVGGNHRAKTPCHRPPLCSTRREAGVSARRCNASKSPTVSL